MNIEKQTRIKQNFGLNARSAFIITREKGFGVAFSVGSCDVVAFKCQ